MVPLDVMTLDIVILDVMPFDIVTLDTVTPVIQSHYPAIQKKTDFTQGECLLFSPTSSWYKPLRNRPKWACIVNHGHAHESYCFYNSDVVMKKYDDIKGQNGRIQR